jgi:hypothetical protein
MGKKKDLFNFVSEEKGSALVLVSLAMVVIIGVASLVTDVGLMYLNSARVANAADAAALAGVQALPKHKVKAEAIARNYASKNGVSDVTVIISPDSKTLEVKAQRQIDLYLARVLGINTSTAAATSKATLEPVIGVKGIVPLGIPQQAFVFGQDYVLKFGGGDALGGGYNSGWLGAIAIEDPGAKAYLDDLKLGFDKIITIGDILNVETGNISGFTFTGVQYRIDSCKHTPSCTVYSYYPDCPKIIILPIIKNYTDVLNSADKKIQVISFAAFLIQKVEGMGNENYITGQFIQYAVAGKSSTTGPDNGIYVPRLTR